MTDGNYRLWQLSDFFYVLERNDDQPNKSWLRKRFKKDGSALEALYDLIEKLDEMGYEDGVEFALQSKRFDTVKGTPLSLIEIRRLGKTWRVIAYWNKERKSFALLDAFEAHKHKSMADMITQVKPLASSAKALLEEGE